MKKILLGVIFLLIIVRLVNAQTPTPANCPSLPNCNDLQGAGYFSPLNSCFDNCSPGSIKCLNGLPPNYSCFNQWTTPGLSPTITPPSSSCPGSGTFCTQTTECQGKDSSNCGLECDTTSPGHNASNGVCTVLAHPDPNKSVCRNNACVGVHDPLCDYAGDPNNTHCQSKCKNIADCVPGGYAGNVCVCKACPQCNTGGTFICDPDWSCIASNPSCSAGVNRCYDTGLKYSEDVSKPQSATFTKPGDQAVFIGPKSNYYGSNWQFQWTSTPHFCTGTFYWYFQNNGQWVLNASQNISTAYCRDKACIFGANWQGTGLVTDRVLLKLNGYTNDQTGCTAKISTVKLRRPQSPVPVQGTIYGHVFVDTNKNCKLDSAESTPIELAEIKSTNNHIDTFSDQKGKWSAVVDIGTYKINVVAPSGYTVNCPAKSITMSGGIKTKVDFLVQPSSGGVGGQGLKNTISPYPTSSNIPSNCPTKNQGDANCDGAIDSKDYEIWQNEYLQNWPGVYADFDNDQQVTIIDYEIWRGNAQH